MEMRCPTLAEESALASCVGNHTWIKTRKLGVEYEYVKGARERDVAESDFVMTNIRKKCEFLSWIDCCALE